MIPTISRMLLGNAEPHSRRPPSRTALLQTPKTYIATKDTSPPPEQGVAPEELCLVRMPYC